MGLCDCDSGRSSGASQSGNSKTDDGAGMCVPRTSMKKMIKEEVRATVYTLDMAHEISNLARKLGKTAYFHIKIDTGMERLGFPATEESADLIGQIEKLPNVCLEGMFTHFAKADELDKTFSEEQYRKFVWMRNEVEKRGISISQYQLR